MADGVSFIGGASARRRRFAAEYVRNGFRGGAAAIKVGYSKKSAASIASDLIALPEVSERIRALTEGQFERAEMGAKETIARISSIARSDVRKFVDDEGNLIAVQDLDDDIARAVKKVTVTKRVSTKGDNTDETETTVLEVEGRVPALTLMARYHRMISDQPAAPAAPSVDALTAQDKIELARRIAFALTRVNAETIEPA